MRVDGVHGLKYPGEEYQIGWDFTPNIAAGDAPAALGEQAVTAVEVGGVDVSATLLGAKALEGNVLKVLVKAGSSGKGYIVTFALKTGAGERFERRVLVSVVA